MAKQLVTDELWTIIEPLLPQEPPKPKGGRPRVADRAALTGIIFVLRTGIPWEYLPPEMGCGSGMTHSLRSGQALLAAPARVEPGQRLAPTPYGVAGPPRGRRP